MESSSKETEKLSESSPATDQDQNGTAEYTAVNDFCSCNDTDISDCTVSIQEARRDENRILEIPYPTIPAC